jgi:teichuronic acid biosynthesis glycosyltransferase TuaC
MRVLLVTNMYPNKQNPIYGIFVKEQIEAIKNIDSQIHFDIIFIDGKANKLN